MPETSRRTRRLRAAWWSVYTTLVVADLLLLTAPIPGVWGPMLSNILLLVIPMLLSVGASTLLSIRLAGTERRVWALLAIALGSISINEFYWMWYQVAVDYRGPVVPNWAQLGHLVGFTAFFLMIAMMTEFGEAPLYTRARVYLDVFGALVVLYVLVYWNWTRNLFVDGPRGGWVTAADIAAYPVLGFLMLVSTLLVIVGWKAHRERSWARLISIAFGAFGVGIIASPAFDAASYEATPATRIDPYYLVLGFASYFLFMAAVYRWTSAKDERRARPWVAPSVKPEWLPMLYPSLLSVAMLVMGLAALRTVDVEGGMVIVWATATLALVLIVRSWVSSVELAHHRTRSITDDVTGAYNQRHLYDQLPRELAEMSATGRTLSAIAVDIVDFRSIARMNGAHAGDQLLAELVALLIAEVPLRASVYRVGLDEFLIAAPGLSEADAVKLARRISARAAARITVAGVPVTLSAGVAAFPEHAGDAETLVTRALASQQLARSAERVDVVAYDVDVVDATDPLQRLERSRRQSHRTALRALAAAVDARDPNTSLHSELVVELASAFALVLDLPAETARSIELAASIHDVGMLVVPDEILLKQARLTADERRIVERHPLESQRLIAPAGLDDVSHIVRNHHERWDGHGYPDGLVGNEIPYEARVLSLCDTFDAITSERHYRPALSTMQALAEIERGAGSQFDPQLADAFAKMVTSLHASGFDERFIAPRSARVDARRG